MLRRAQHERRLLNEAKCARARRARGQTGQYWRLLPFPVSELRSFEFAKTLAEHYTDRHEQ